MIKNKNWKRTLFTIGVIALIVGALDPLEGSIIITIGSGLIVSSTQRMKDPYRKLFLAAFVMICFGVFFLFYLSGLGGFGGTSTLSWWLALLIVPYPVGWLLNVVLLIIRKLKKQKHFR